MISVVLFLMVFIGRGVFPGQRSAVQELLSDSWDIGAWFQNVKDYLGKDDQNSSGVTHLLSSLLLSSPQPEAEQQSESVQLLSALPMGGVEYLYSSSPLAVEPQQEATEEVPQEEPAPSPASEPSPTTEIVTAVAQTYTADGVKLPSNVSMDFYELGLENTVCPVMGPVTSTFGYRTSPITGENEFHLALDIAAEEGTEIKAFADGVVEYIGESDDFGLYLKISHANQASSFYAHCSKLLVQKGDSISCGQTVALVGETGAATGPHLHLTIEKDNIRLDPAYYVDPS